MSQVLARIDLSDETRSTMVQRVSVRREVVGDSDDSTVSELKSEVVEENCSNVSDSVSTNLDTSSRE